MAIDTAEKRKSVAGIPFYIFLGVTPNAGKDVEWRQQAGWGYSGIEPEGGAVAVGQRQVIRFANLAFGGTSHWSR